MNLGREEGANEADPPGRQFMQRTEVYSWSGAKQAQINDDDLMAPNHTPPFGLHKPSHPYQLYIKMNVYFLI